MEARSAGCHFVAPLRGTVGSSLAIRSLSGQGCASGQKGVFSAMSKRGCRSVTMTRIERQHSAAGLG